MKNIPNREDQNFLDLLARWLRGDFRHSDLPEAQNLTKSDEFRHEAWQGYQNTSSENHEESLTKLSQKIAKRVGGEAPTMRVVWHFNRIAAAAAVVTTLLAAVWFFRKNNAVENTLTASQSIENQLDSMTNPAIASYEMNSSEEMVLTENATVLSAKTTAVPPSSPRVGAIQNKEFASDIADDAITSASTDVPSPSKSVETTDVMPPKTSETNHSDVVFEEKSPPSPSGSASSARKKFDTDAKHEVKKSKTSPTDKSELPNAPEPFGGWDNFNEYIRQNARLPEARGQDNFAGTVVLQFSPQPDGSTGPILVVKSMGQALDDEAKRLVQLFDWQMGKNNLVRVPIRFQH